MFSWSFSKPAEAMLSRWAIKRVCKFLLKKKLGKFILGDIDLNQLDVQLGAGTIKLSDLAINVDYINEKFGTAPVLVKEGSVGLLTVTMPWKENGCQIEVDELEIVLAPRRVGVSEDELGSCSPSKNEKEIATPGSRKINSEPVNTGGAGLVGVHDGVKAIANWVKWLLTSFHVKIKKLIVAFDPLLEEENRSFERILVLHLSEVECGTHISGDDSASSFLGSSRLTSFLRFHGARLELLHMDDRNPHPTTESALYDSFTACYLSENITKVISGEKGGFSGSLKLSVPWKNGSLDIHKVDADLDIEPLEVTLQPSTIRCFISMWGLFEAACEHGDSVYLEPSENSPPTTSSVVPSDKVFLGKEVSVDKSCLNDKKPASFLLSESQLISDWVTKSHRDVGEEELDFGASVEQFFECFDELRSSQSALGNSGMWTWTCSVFSAITAASNLASGSLQVPSEQVHIETKFNATLAKACLRLSLIDEDQKHYEVKDDKAHTGLHNHVMCAELVDLVLVLQVRPQETNFDVTVQHIQLVDHLCRSNILVNSNMHGSGNCENEIALIRKIQHDVQDALFREINKDPNINHQKVDISLDLKNTEECFHMTNGNNTCGSATLLKTSGVTRCHVRMNSISSGSSSTGPLSLSLELAPFVFWVDFNLITMASKFLTQIADFSETTRTGDVLVLKSEAENSGPSTPGDQGKLSHRRSKNTSTKNSFKVNIMLPNARILLCFPPREHGDCSFYSSCHQVIAFDVVSPAIGVNKDLSSKPFPVASVDNKDPVATSSSLNVHFGNFHVFSVSLGLTEKIARSEAHSRVEANHTVEKILSAVDKSGRLSLFSIHWLADPKTGPWIAQKAKHLASSENGSREDHRVAKNSEFASVTTAKDVVNYDTHSRQEIFYSSACFVHAKLPPVAVSLNKSQYSNINDLLQMLEQISSAFSDSVSISEDSHASQTSVFLECDSVTVALAVEPFTDVKSSILSELSGSWLSLTLQVDKFELISTSNIGGLKKSSFLWVSHHQGSLWGSVTECMNQKFLLVSCSNSSLGRGDGVGSNVLSSGYSGLDFIHYRDPNSNHKFISITVRGATVIANGGRLDWISSLSSFFTLPSDEFDQVSSNRKEETSGSSFILNLVDAGLSYEPYLQKLEGNQDTDFTFLNSSSNKSENKYVACLLAASDLKLSNKYSVDCPTGEYKIRLQDIGLLLCPVYQDKPIGGAYSAQHLVKVGYVKVAQEAQIEVILRTNSENGHVWELECVESHIMLSTCHDTTLGLITLAGQLQKLFAPDMQDYVVHLENRWNNIQKVHGRSDECTSDCESPSLSLAEALSLDTTSKIGSLMDEVLEDVFQLDGGRNSGDNFFGSRLHSLDNDSHVPTASSSEDKMSDIIDEYFMSDLRPAARNPSSDVIYRKTGPVKEAQVRNDGWYTNTSWRILENHLSKVEWTNEQKPINIEASFGGSENSNAGKVEGCIHLKNMNVTWRMYDGSDWSHVQSTFQTSPRESKTCMELSLSGLDFNYDLYPDGEVYASTTSLAVQDLCLKDRSANAPWKLVLGGYQSKKHPRKSSSSAVKLNLETVRPEPSLRIEENRLRISFLPLRLHLHQNQLDFFINLFGGKSSLADPSTSSSTPVAENNDNLQDFAINEEAFLPYFQKFDISPMLIRVDYTPCRFDLTALRGGKYVELVNLVPWKGIELKLKHVNGVGLYGWGSVCEAILGEWLEDISQNQVHKLVKGLPPIKSLVAVGSGAAKLVSLPVKSYRRDRRLLKGVQRGTFAFLRSISLEAIGLGVHLAAGAHEILLQAEYILASIPPSVPWPTDARGGTNVKSNQPMDVQQGLQQACQSISDGLGKSASALVQNPLKKYQRGAGVGSALASAVQSAPAAAIAPAVATARAMHCAFLGFRNSFNPEHKRESLEKYAGGSPPHESSQ